MDHLEPLQHYVWIMTRNKTGHRTRWIDFFGQFYNNELTPLSGTNFVSESCQNQKVTNIYLMVLKMVNPSIEIRKQRDNVHVTYLVLLLFLYITLICTGTQVHCLVELNTQEIKNRMCSKCMQLYKNTRIQV